MKARFTAGLALSAVAALALSACAQGNSGADDDVSYDPSASLPAVELTLMGFAKPDDVGQTRLDIANEAIAPSSAKPSEASFDMQSFLAANSAGNAPDLIYFNRGDFAGQLASLGAIMPLDDCISGVGIDRDIYNQAAFAQVTFDGKTYGLPEFNQVQLTQANGDLLTAAGLTIEDVNGSSWDKVAAAATAMTKNEGGTLQTVGYDPKIPEFFPLWAKANGADLISEDGKTANLNDPKVVEALEFAMSVIDSEGGWAGIKSQRDSFDMFGAENPYAMNQLGAMNMEQWYLNVLGENSPDVNLATSPFISQETGKPIAMATGSTWAIPTKAKNKDVACRFIQSMTATDTWMAAAKQRAETRASEGQIFTGLLTANVEADEQIRDTYVTDTGSDVWNTAIDSMYAANDNLFYLPANPADQDFKKTWQDAISRVMTGEQDAQTALDQAQTEAQAILDAAWEKMGSGSSDDSSK